MSDLSKGENQNWWKKILGGLIVVYIVLIIFVPKASEGNNKSFPGRLETPEVILISLAFLFNSGLVERLRNLTLSKDEINIELGELEQKVENAKKVVEEVQQEDTSSSAQTDKSGNLEKAKEELDLLNTKIRLLKGHLK